MFFLSSGKFSIVESLSLAFSILLSLSKYFVISAIFTNFWGVVVATAVTLHLIVTASFWGIPFVYLFSTVFPTFVIVTVVVPSAFFTAFAVYFPWGSTNSTNSIPAGK